MPKKTDDGRWLVDMRPESGYGRRVRKLFNDKAEALRFEAHARQAATQKKPWNPRAANTARLDFLIARWHSIHGQHLKDGESRTRMLSGLSKRLGNPVVTRLTPQHYHDDRTARLAAGITANTCNHELAYFNAVINELTRAGEWSDGNPLAGVRRLKLDEKELSWLTTDQIRELLDACASSTNPSLLPMVRVCLATGARWGEASALKAGQIRGGKISFHGTKSGKSRTVPYVDDVIDKYIEGKKGKYFTSCSDAFKFAIDRAGIELPKGQLTHVLRHTYGAHYMMNGGNILVLKQILGHASITMTMRYAHFAPDHLADAPRRSPLASLKVGHF